MIRQTRRHDVAINVLFHAWCILKKEYQGREKKYRNRKKFCDVHMQGAQKTFYFFRIHWKGEMWMGSVYPQQFITVCTRIFWSRWSGQKRGFPEVPLQCPIPRTSWEWSHLKKYEENIWTACLLKVSKWAAKVPTHVWGIQGTTPSPPLQFPIVIFSRWSILGRWINLHPEGQS